MSPPVRVWLLVTTFHNAAALLILEFFRRGGYSHYPLPNLLLTSEWVPQVDSITPGPQKDPSAERNAVPRKAKVISKLTD